MRFSIKKMKQNNLKVYIFFTENIRYLVDILMESANGIENTEFIPVLHENIYSDCELGNLGGQGYLEMCLHNHLTKLEIMKQNIGSNILLIDADIVFNKKLNFTNEINNLLLLNDYLFQYDSNSAMSQSINLGITAVKCSELSISLWENHCDIISKIPSHDRKPGFPQIEFNNLIGSEFWKSKINFEILPKTFGFPHENSYCYHAICVSDKIESLQNMLNIWK